MSSHATKIKTTDAHRDFSRRLMCGKTWLEIMDNPNEPCNECAKLNKCLTLYARLKPGYRNRKRKVRNDTIRNIQIRDVE